MLRSAPGKPSLFQIIYWLLHKYNIMVHSKDIHATFILVLRPGKGECADPVNEDAILEKDGGGSPTAGIGSVS